MSQIADMASTLKYNVERIRVATTSDPSETQRILKLEEAVVRVAVGMMSAAGYEDEDVRWALERAELFSYGYIVDEEF